MEPEQLPASDKLQLTPDFRTKPIHITVIAMKPFTLNHELGRVPAGWVVIDSTGMTKVWRSGVMDRNQLELTADKDSDISVVLL